MQRSPPSPQIHQKYIYMRNNSHRTPTERWQKTSDLPKEEERKPKLNPRSRENKEEKGKFLHVASRSMD